MRTRTTTAESAKSVISARATRRRCVRGRVCWTPRTEPRLKKTMPTIVNGGRLASGGQPSCSVAALRSLTLLCVRVSSAAAWPPTKPAQKSNDDTLVDRWVDRGVEGLSTAELCSVRAV
eukprot:scaffold55253_cov61-Phaeocystis_antarctica.AAC.19